MKNNIDKDIFNIIKKQAPELNDKFIPKKAENLISKYISAKKLIDPSKEISFKQAQKELKDIFLDADRKLENKAQLFDLIMYHDLGAGKDKFYLLILERLIEIRKLDSASDLEVVYSYEWGKKQRADQFIEKKFLNYIDNEEKEIKTNKLDYKYPDKIQKDRYREWYGKKKKFAYNSEEIRQYKFFRLLSTVLNVKDTTLRLDREMFEKMNNANYIEHMIDIFNEVTGEKADFDSVYEFIFKNDKGHDSKDILRALTNIMEYTPTRD